MNLVKRPDVGDISNFTGQVAGGAGVPQQGIPQIVGLVINVIFSVVGLIFLVLMVYGGVRWMTSRGNEDEVQAARNTVFRASIGLAIILAAYAIVNFFFGKL